MNTLTLTKLTQKLDAKYQKLISKKVLKNCLQDNQEEVGLSSKDKKKEKALIGFKDSYFKCRKYGCKAVNFLEDNQNKRFFDKQQVKFYACGKMDYFTIDF